MDGPSVGISPLEYRGSSPNLLPSRASPACPAVPNCPIAGAAERCAIGAATKWSCLLAAPAAGSGRSASSCAALIERSAGSSASSTRAWLNLTAISAACLEEGRARKFISSYRNGASRVRIHKATSRCAYDAVGGLSAAFAFNARTFLMDQSDTRKLKTDSAKATIAKASMGHSWKLRSAIRRIVAQVALRRGIASRSPTAHLRASVPPGSESQLSIGGPPISNAGRRILCADCVAAHGKVSFVRQDAPTADRPPGDPRRKGVSGT